MELTQKNSERKKNVGVDLNAMEPELHSIGTCSHSLSCIQSCRKFLFSLDNWIILAGSLQTSSVPSSSV